MCFGFRENNVDNTWMFELLLSGAYSKSRIFNSPRSAREQVHKKL